MELSAIMNSSLPSSHSIAGPFNAKKKNFASEEHMKVSIFAKFNRQ